LTLRVEATEVSAKLIIYQAFIEPELDLPKLAAPVHKLYLNPEYEEFEPSTMWSLSLGGHPKPALRGRLKTG
jgi:hypothetical protein